MEKDSGEISIKLQRAVLLVGALLVAQQTLMVPMRYPAGEKILTLVTSYVPRTSRISDLSKVNADAQKQSGQAGRTRSIV